MGWPLRNDLYQTASSDSDVATPGLMVERPENALVPTPDHTRTTSNTKLKTQQPPPRAPTAAATGLTIAYRSLTSLEVVSRR